MTTQEQPSTAAAWESSPALDIDARIAAIRGTAQRSTPENARRLRLEREIAYNLMQHLSRAGFEVVATWDGEDRERVHGNVKAAMEFIFNLDEVSVRFRKTGTRPDGTRWPEHGVLLVLGNEWDIVSDWNYTEGDPDGFSAAVDAFTDIINEKQEAGY